MKQATKITITPSLDKAMLEAQILTEETKYNEAATDSEKETALKNYHYLQSFYHSHFLNRDYKRQAPFNQLA
jgi:hypothetical protein